MIGADWESQNKIHSSWENAGCMRWHLSRKCASWETFLVFSCCGDQASSGPTHPAFCPTGMTLRPHRPWQDSWSTTSIGCMASPSAEGGSIPCHSTSQECIILIGIKVSSFEKQWPHAIAFFPVFPEYRQRRKLCCTLACCNSVSQVGVIREVQVSNSEWQWYLSLSGRPSLFVCSCKEEGVWSSKPQPFYSFYSFILTLFFVFMDKMHTAF